MDIRTYLGSYINYVGWLHDDMHTYVAINTGTHHHHHEYMFHYTRTPTHESQQRQALGNEQVLPRSDIGHPIVIVVVIISWPCTQVTRFIVPQVDSIITELSSVVT